MLRDSDPAELNSSPRSRRRHRSDRTEGSSRNAAATALSSHSSIVSGLQSIRAGSVLSSISSRASSRPSAVTATQPQHYYDRRIQLSQLEHEKTRLEGQIAALSSRQQAETTAAAGKDALHGLDSQKQTPVRLSPRQQEPQSESGWQIREFSARYKTIKKLKGGAMAVVYLAKDVECAAFHREVILKLLLGGASYEQRQRFIREVQLVVQIRHPNVVQYHDVGEQADGTLFIAMEVLQGTDLQVLLDKVGRIEQGEALGIAVGVLSALESCHGLQILHRDIKPANIVFHAASNQLKLIDFGLAKHVLTASDLTGDHVVGTPMYFAPEQTRSGATVTAALDLWAVGVLLFHTVSGTLPFAKLGDALEVIVHEIRTQAPRDLAALAQGNAAPALVDVVNRALVKDPTLRVQTAAEMKALVLDALRAIGPGGTAAGRSPPPESQRGDSREGGDTALRSVKGRKLRGDPQAVAGVQQEGRELRGGDGQEALELKARVSEGERERRNLQRLLEEARDELRSERERGARERREREAEQAEAKRRGEEDARVAGSGVSSTRSGGGDRRLEARGSRTSGGGSSVSHVSSSQGGAAEELERLRADMKAREEELEKVFEELAGKELELEDASEQLTSLKQTAATQLEEAAAELGQMRARAEEAERELISVRGGKAAFGGGTATGKSVAWGEEDDLKGGIAAKGFEESSSLVPWEGPLKSGKGEDNSAMALVPSSGRRDRPSTKLAQSRLSGEGSSDEDGKDEDAREVDRLKYQRFTRDREIDRLRGEVGTLRGMVGQKDRDIKTLGREMELKDAELRSTRAVEKREKRGVVTVHECRFLLNGDTNGVFYLMGSTAVGGLWQNPARLGLARVLCGLNGVTAMNGVREIHAAKEDVLERSVVSDSFAFNDGWCMIDLDPRDQGVTLHPTYYTLRNGGGKGRCMTGWVLEGSDSVEQNAKWKTLDAHQQDESFLMLASETGRDEYPHHSLSWLLHAKRPYRTFRLRQKSNHWGSKQLFLQGFELYGMLRLPNTHPAAAISSADAPLPPAHR